MVFDAVHDTEDRREEDDDEDYDGIVVILIQTLPGVEPSTCSGSNGMEFKGPTKD